MLLRLIIEAKTLHVTLLISHECCLVILGGRHYWERQKAVSSDRKVGIFVRLAATQPDFLVGTKNNTVGI